MLEFLSEFTKNTLIGAIRFYQIVLSPDQGIFSFIWRKKFCKYEPSCSQYAAQAIREQGPFMGIFIATKRILRCHPWAKGGFDPLVGKNPISS